MLKNPGKTAKVLLYFLKVRLLLVLQKWVELVNLFLLHVWLIWSPKLSSKKIFSLASSKGTECSWYYSSSFFLQSSGCLPVITFPLTLSFSSLTRSNSFHAISPHHFTFYHIHSPCKYKCVVSCLLRKENCKSTCFSVFFPCQRLRAPKYCLNSPPFSHPLYHSTHISFQSSSTLLPP